VLDILPALRADIHPDLRMARLSLGIGMGGGVLGCLVMWGAGAAFYFGLFPAQLDQSTRLLVPGLFALGGLADLVVLPLVLRKRLLRLVATSRARPTADAFDMTVVALETRRMGKTRVATAEIRQAGEWRCDELPAAFKVRLLASSTGDYGRQAPFDARVYVAKPGAMPVLIEAGDTRYWVDSEQAPQPA